MGSVDFIATTHPELDLPVVEVHQEATEQDGAEHDEDQCGDDQQQRVEPGTDAGAAVVGEHHQQQR